MRSHPVSPWQLLSALIVHACYAEQNTINYQELRIQATDSPQIQILTKDTNSCVFSINTAIPTQASVILLPMNFAAQTLKNTHPPAALTTARSAPPPQRRYRVGRIGFTQQCFHDEPSNLWILHYLCDHPGELSVSITSPLSPARLEHQWLMVNDPTSKTTIGVQMLPFESSLDTSNCVLSTQGEGELFIIIAQTSATNSPDSLIARWHDFLKRNRENNLEHPDLHALSVNIANSHRADKD